MINCKMRGFLYRYHLSFILFDLCANGNSPIHLNFEPDIDLGYIVRVTEDVMRCFFKTSRYKASDF